MENLGIRDAEVLAEWFLYHMGPEQRGKLMAEHPLIYARLFPSVPDTTIIGCVQRQILEERRKA